MQCYLIWLPGFISTNIFLIMFITLIMCVEYIYLCAKIKKNGIENFELK